MEDIGFLLLLEMSCCWGFPLTPQVLDVTESHSEIYGPPVVLYDTRFPARRGLYTIDWGELGVVALVI